MFEQTTPIPGSYKVGAQTPLDSKGFFRDVDDMKNVADYRPLIWYVNMRAINMFNGKTYKWVESVEGLILGGYTYPENVVSFGIDYSSRTFNFVEVSFYTKEEVDALIADILNNIPSTGDQIAPNKVINLAVSSSEDSALVAWDASTDDVGVVGYELSYTLTTDTSWTSVIETFPNILEIYKTVIEIPNGGYKFRVRAFDASGNYSPYSDEATVTINVAPIDSNAPTKPSGLTVVVGSGAQDTEVTVSWNASTDDVGIDRYELEYTLFNGNNPNWNNATTIATGSLTHFQVMPRDKHLWRVRAFDTNNNPSPYSWDELSDTTDKIDPVFGGWENFVANDITNFPYRITGDWIAGTDNVGIDKYVIGYYDTALGWQSVTEVEVAANLTEHTFNLYPGMWAISIQAKDAANNGSSTDNNTITIADAVLSAPTPATATTDGEYRVDVAWGSVQHAVSYEIQYKAQGVEWEDATILTRVGLSTNIDLLANDTYYFKVRANGAYGEVSAWSVITHVVNYVPQPSRIYYGQSVTSTPMTGPFFQQVDNDADGAILGQDWRLYKLEMYASGTIQIPFLGDAFNNPSLLHLVRHFIVLPLGLRMQKSYNESLPANVFFDITTGKNDYNADNGSTGSTTTIDIGGFSYLVMEMTLSNPLGGNVSVEISKLV